MIRWCAMNCWRASRARCTNMEPLLNDLSQLYGQVEGTCSSSPQQVDLNEWLLPSLLPWRTVAQEKGLAVADGYRRDLPVIEIDPDRLNQVLGNLISNAIKYTPQGGAVTVTADAEPGLVNIGVCDTGPGIAPRSRNAFLSPSTAARRTAVSRRAWDWD